MARRSYTVDAETLARRLLGGTLVRLTEDGVRLSGRIVEVEAYLGARDKAAHSYKRRRTARTEPMYAAGGTSYVYFTYGMHHCMNVVAGRVDEPVAVLLRALEPLEGQAVMRSNRGVRKSGRAWAETELCSGPARLCRAFGIDRSMSGVDLTGDARLWIESRARAPRAHEIVTAARIGIAYAEEWTDKALRWYLRDSAHVSVRAPSEAQGNA